MTRPVVDAVETVARELLHRLVQDTAALQWEAFPEIGENDWLAVLEHAAVLAPPVPRGDYLAAYALLADRAEPGA